MTPSVHILAQNSNPALMRATTLVFDTIRVGFPDNEICVNWKGMRPAPEAVLDAVRSADVDHFEHVAPITHAAWIGRLLGELAEPFFICDTDMVFWKRFPDEFAAPLAGRYTPRFYDAYTKCITLPRLHTCLMYFDPLPLLEKVKAYRDKFPKAAYVPQADLIAPGITPWLDGKSYFHDVACLLYHAVGGQVFHEAQNECFDHLQAGTISDEVGKAYPGLAEENAMLLEHPEMMRGLWNRHLAMYAMSP